MTERTMLPRGILWLGLAVVAVVLVYLLRDMLAPFIAGIAIAYFLDPLADRLERAGLNRGLGVALMLGVFLGGLVLALVLLAPLLQEQVLGFVGRIPELIAALQEVLAPLIERAQSALAANGLPDVGGGAGDMAGNMAKGLAGWLQGLFGGIWAGGMAAVHALSVILIMPLVAFYLLRDWDRIVAHLDSLLPRSGGETVRAQVRQVDRTLSAFVRGQASVCAILAVIYGGGLTLTGLDFGLLIGIGTGVLSFIPYFGMGLGLVAAITVAIFQFSDFVSFLPVMAVFAVGQVAEGFFLTPRLVGGQVGLHPLWVVFALMAGATLFGFTGVLLAVPTAAVIGVLVRFWAARYRDAQGA